MCPGLALRAMPTIVEGSCAQTSCGKCGGIPRISHQSWKTDRVPLELRPLSERWRASPEEWRHRFWSDDGNRQLWVQYVPQLLPTYDGYSNAVQRADATRLLYMHLFGGAARGARRRDWRTVLTGRPSLAGVYADLDVAPCDRMWKSLQQVRRPVA